MAAPALARTSHAPVFSETALRIILFAVLIYWGFIAFTFPVTNWDSQVYNLSRLAIAEKAGFWQTTSWNSVRQVMFPWTYDAVHFPFLRLGCGFALPSFGAFLGILAIAYNLISPRWGRSTALWACLTLTAMPTMVLQATSTKNDLVIAFVLGCWLYGFERYRRTTRRKYLILGALSLSFGIGAKASAILPCAICTLITLYLLRREPLSLLYFIGSYLPLLILFGSVETYALSYRCFHHPLGEPNFLADHVNRDGFRGAAANFIRYFFGNLSLGIDGSNAKSGLSGLLEKACRSILHILQLANAGYRSDFNDKNMHFVKYGVASSADFGLPGAICMVSAPALALRFRSSPAVAFTASAGLLWMVFLSSSVGWMEWNARFLCTSFVLFGLAFSVAFFSNPNRNRFIVALIGLLVIWSAISYPLLTQYERPADLSAVFHDRKKLQFSENLDLRKVYNRVRQIRSSAGKVPWFLLASENSWTLPFLTIPRMDWRLTPQWSMIGEWQKNNPQKPAYVLVLQRAYQNELPADLENSYPANTLILKIPASN